MQVEQALGELGHLADAAGDGDARHGMRAQIFQHAADEIAHVDQRGLGQVVQFLDCGLGCRAGRAGDLREARGASDIDAAMDRMDPSRAGIGHDDAGGAEDRQSADDAEPSVEGLGRERFAAGNGDLDLDIAGVAVGRRNLRDGLAQHLARHGIDGGLAGRNGKAGPRDHAHAFAGTKAHAASGRGAPNGGEDQRAVGDVGVVAGVLDHACRRRAIAHRCGGEREGRMLAPRQGHLDRIGKLPGQKRLIGRLGGRGGAGSGGPAIAERAVFRCHAPRYSADEEPRHGLRQAA